jgi:hypothetical protein
MAQIIKTKFLCKSGSRISARGSTIIWEDRFIEGKWYESFYETWSFEEGYVMNNGWRRYWVVNEQGLKEEISRAHMRIIFETDIQHLRDKKIEDIIN